MTSDPDPSPYTIRAIQEMLGLSRSVITGLIASGFVAPSRGPRNEYRFTFQDVVLLRTASHLQAAEIAPRKILRSLSKLRASLPESDHYHGSTSPSLPRSLAVLYRGK